MEDLKFSHDKKCDLSRYLKIMGLELNLYV